MQELCDKEVLSGNEEISVIEKPSSERSFLIGYYNYTVVLTYIGMLIGFLGILFAVKGMIPQSLLCLLLSGFCDMFDGAVASTRKRTRQEKRFGIQIDSLSDLICFGVLPALTVNAVSNNPFSFPVCGLYVLCALIRLSYFNVDEEERQDKTSEKREFYKGLPVTTMAIILPCFYKLLPYNFMYLILLFMAAIAFVSPIDIKKPNTPAKLIMLLLGIFAFANVLLGII